MGTDQLISKRYQATDQVLDERLPYVPYMYDALDWLWERKERIEKKLAARHLTDGGYVFYDVSSSYYEGVTCPLAQRGYNRDNKKGTPSIVYGVMTDSQGTPVSVDVYPGNTGDPATVEDQIERLRDRFGLGRVVFVGDRGMLTQARIGVLKEHGWVGWISALRSKAIRSLMDDDVLQLSLFDECDLAKITSPDYPQERLVACFNPRLQARRGRKRQVLIEATEQGLEAIARAVRRRTKRPLTADQIGVKVGRVLGKYKMAKHLIVDIKDNHLSWELNRESIEMEQRHGGVYVVRTSETRNSLAAEDVVRNYKRLIAVETAFRNLKSIDLLIRPIRHRTVERVKAHIFLSLLSYYVQKHIRDAWAPMLFAEEDIENRRKNRHPVKPATPSLSAKTKKHTKQTENNEPVHSFHTLMAELGTQCKNACRFGNLKNSPTIHQITKPTPLQRKAYELLGLNCTQ